MEISASEFLGRECYPCSCRTLDLTGIDELVKFGSKTFDACFFRHFPFLVQESSCVICSLDRRRSITLNPLFICRMVGCFVLICLVIQLLENMFSMSPKVYCMVQILTSLSDAGRSLY